MWIIPTPRHGCHTLQILYRPVVIATAGAWTMASTYAWSGSVISEGMTWPTMNPMMASGSTARSCVILTETKTWRGCVTWASLPPWQKLKWSLELQAASTGKVTHTHADKQTHKYSQSIFTNRTCSWSSDTDITTLLQDKWTALKASALESQNSTISVIHYIFQKGKLKCSSKHCISKRLPLCRDDCLLSFSPSGD